jgi:hypothetical protein
VSLSTPVALFIFNRPQLTETVLNVIAQARPRKLLVVADGPRFPEEAARCQQARDIVRAVDWDCQVLTDFSPINLGCKRRVSTGLDWVFKSEPQAVILEDDCLPDLTFFRFCEELLEVYRDDNRIMMISGDNYQGSGQHIRYSYYFSRYTHIWGWATWRRAWRFFDAEMRLWPEIRDNGWLERVYDNPAEVKYRRLCFEGTYSGAIDTWDYAWSLACLVQSGLVIRPCTNLVSNIGSGPEATHTRHAPASAGFPRSAMIFPLRHPPFVLRDARLDSLEAKRLIGTSCAARIRIAAHRLRNQLERLAQSARRSRHPHSM